MLWGGCEGKSSVPTASTSEGFDFALSRRRGALNRREHGGSDDSPCRNVEVGAGAVTTRPRLFQDEDAMQKFVLRTPMPSLNNIINDAKKMVRVGRKRFNAWQDRKKYIEASIRRELTVQKVKPITSYPIRAHLTIYWRDRKSDKSNIVAGVEKVLWDAMQADDTVGWKGVLSSDGWKFFADDDPVRVTYRIDKRDPRVEVRIESTKEVVE